MRFYLTLLILLLAFASSFGQAPLAAFNLQATGCLGEDITIKNLSTQASRYEWDLCQGDLALTPTGVNAGTFTGSITPTGIEVAFDGTNWFGFVASRDNNSIYRISMGTDLTGFANLTNLGNPGSSLTQPIDIKVVTDNGKYYAFVFTEGANTIVRLDFGSSLTSTPTATVVLNSPLSRIFQNQGLDVIPSGGKWYIVYTINYKVGVLRLNDLETIPAAGDQMLTSDLTGSPSISDITILEQAGNFFAYTASTGASELFRLSFGNNLFSTPTVDDISSGLPAAPPSLNYYGIGSGNDGGKFYLIFSTLQGSMARVDLGPDLSAAPVGGDVPGNFGVFFNTVKNTLVKHKTTWYNFAVDYVNGTLFKAEFPTPNCTLSPGLFTTTDLPVEFTTAGDKHISLRSFNALGGYDDLARTINISSLQAPDISFTNQQICVQTAVQFNSTSNQTLNAINWDFGDGHTSTLSSPQNTYTAIGTYNVSVLATSSNSCTNRSIRSIKIYSPPDAQFTLPTGLICTNNQFSFTNQTVDNFDGNLQYQWLVDNTAVSTVRDLQYAFTSLGDHTVKLITSIPGCSDEQSQTLPGVKGGPTVGFTISGQCETLAVNLTNQSSGDITGFVWDLGNGQTSTTTNVTQVYPKGNYNVKLTATSSNGCTSVTTKPLPIYSLPAPDFALDLPPFSCTSPGSQLKDLTPPPSDSNLESWRYDFDDNTFSTSRNPTHAYITAGSKHVKLTVTTDKGCSAITEKDIVILQSPAADFIPDPLCVNQGARFKDASTGDIKSWNWKIGSTTYTVANPIHIFLVPGTYQAQLTVTATNGCISTMNRNVVVPQVPFVDFKIQNACAQQTTTFVPDVTSPQDAPTGYTWTFEGQTTNLATHVFGSSGSYPVKMVVLNQSGCSYELTKNITINSLPVAAFTISQESGPPPLSISFTNTSSGASSYKWTFGSPTQTSTATSPSFTFASVGDYSVDLTATTNLGCAVTTSKKISVIIPRTDLSLEDFKLVRDDNTGRMQGILTVRNQSNYAVKSFEVNIDFGAGLQLTETMTASFLPGAVETFALKNQLSGSNQLSGFVCVTLEADADEVVTNDDKCIALGTEPTVFVPYPNPAGETVTFEKVSADGGEVNIRLFDTSGGVAYNKSIETTAGLSQIVINVQDLNPGLYIAVISFGGQTVSRRVFIR